jgi:transposase
MAGQRIDIMELRQLIQLKSKGMSNRKVARELGISRNTVNAYVQTFQARELDYRQLGRLSDTELSELFPEVDYKDAVRYEQLAGCFAQFEKQLTQTGCTLQTLWADYLQKYPGGYRYTQFVHYYRAWSRKTRPSGILHHTAGAKLFIDFAGKKLSYVDRGTGEIIPVEVFVAILPASQYTYVRAVHTQKRADLVCCINDCMAWLGGVPQAIVSDNMKTAVAKGHKYAPIINKTLKDLALHYDCVIDPTRPYRPQDKALVEGAVKLVYQRIYYQLSKHTFFSLEELNAAIAALLVEYNEYRFQNRDTTRRGQFVDLEKQALQPLPPGRYEMREYKRAKVQKISHIYVGADKNYYSVPHRYIGHQLEVQMTSTIVEVFYNSERVAQHRRSFTRGRYTTIPAHMPSTHQVYNEWNPNWFAKRAAQVGPCTQSYIVRLIDQYTYPEIGYKQSQGILSFAKSYGQDRLERACKRAGSYHKAAYRTIDNILKNNLDQIELPEEDPPNPIPEHTNIRGAANYN